jgi:ankyrin repeat protein
MRPAAHPRRRPARRAAASGRLPLARVIATCLCAATVAGSLPNAAAQESANVRLVAATRAGDQAGVTRALAQGATPNARNRLGESALLIALQNDRPELATQMLAAGADVNLAAVNGVTPLMAAAHGGYADIVRELLAKGADVNAADQLRKTAMIYAAGEGRTEVVVLLLHAGIDPNAVYAHRLTALMWAAGYGHSETVQALLDAGAQTEPRDDRGKSALDIAREGEFAATATLLEAAVCD